MDSELVELVRSIHNRCEVILELYGSGKASKLEFALPTLLEDLYHDAQTIATEHCTEQNDD